MTTPFFLHMISPAWRAVMLVLHTARRVRLRTKMRPATRARAVWKPAGFDPAPSHVDAEQARTFIEQRGYPPAVAAAIVEELKSPHWSAGSAGGVLALATRLAGRWEVGEDAGLATLAASLERARAASEGRVLVSFVVQPARGSPFHCQAYDGMSLKEVAEWGEDQGARLLAEHLECACSGVMACSTCHVYVNEEWMSAVGEPTEDEEDMLDLAYERRPNSRLGCQLTFTPKLEGLKLKIPAGANNLFDHIPFEDR
jgi:ferredoxin